jgi:hypothetical protein
MRDKEGNEVDEDPAKMYGRPSTYHMLRLDWCVFVDETGCNTNQKNDGCRFGELFVVPVEQAENERTGTTTDLHFTILPFISGTGEAIMCAVVLKYEKPVSELPIKWIYGLDYPKIGRVENMKLVCLRIILVKLKQWEGDLHAARIGVDIPCFVCSSPKSSITTKLLCEMLDPMTTLIYIYSFYSMAISHGQNWSFWSTFVMKI